jgi:hypothetical protein
VKKRDLKERGFQDAAEAMSALYKKLDKEISIYLSKRNADSLDNCKKSIADARTVLNVHRGWTKLVFNTLLNALILLFTFGLAPKQWLRSTETESSIVLSQLEKSLEVSFLTNNFLPLPSSVTEEPSNTSDSLSLDVEPNNTDSDSQVEQPQSVIAPSASDVPSSARVNSSSNNSPKEPQVIKPVSVGTSKVTPIVIIEPKKADPKTATVSSDANPVIMPKKTDKKPTVAKVPKAAKAAPPVIELTSVPAKVANTAKPVETPKVTPIIVQAKPAPVQAPKEPEAVVIVKAAEEKLPPIIVQAKPAPVQAPKESEAVVIVKAAEEKLPPIVVQAKPALVQTPKESEAVVTVKAAEEKLPPIVVQAKPAPVQAPKESEAVVTVKAAEEKLPPIVVVQATSAPQAPKEPEAVTVNAMVAKVTPIVADSTPSSLVKTPQAYPLVNAQPLPVQEFKSPVPVYVEAKESPRVYRDDVIEPGKEPQGSFPLVPASSYPVAVVEQKLDSPQSKWQVLDYVNTVMATLNGVVLLVQVEQALAVPFEKPFAGTINSFNKSVYTVYGMAIQVPGKAGSVLYSVIPAKAYDYVPGVQGIGSVINYELVDDISVRKLAADVVDFAGPVVANSALVVLDKLTRGATDLSGIRSVARTYQAHKKLNYLNDAINDSLNRHSEFRDHSNEVKAENFKIATRITEPTRLLQGVGYAVGDGLKGYSAWKHVSLGRAATIAAITGYPLTSKILSGAQKAVTVNSCLNFVSSGLNLRDVFFGAYGVSQVGLGTYSLEGIKTIVLASIPELPKSKDWDDDCPFELRAQGYGAALYTLNLPKRAAELTETIIANICNAGAKSSKLAVESVGPAVSSLIFGAKYFGELPDLPMTCPAPQPFHALPTSPRNPLANGHFDAVGMAVSSIYQDVCLHLGLHLASKVTAPFFAGLTKRAIRSQLTQYEPQIRDLVEQQLREKIKGFLFNPNEVNRLEEDSAKRLMEVGRIKVQLTELGGRTAIRAGTCLVNATMDVLSYFGFKGRANAPEEKPEADLARKNRNVVNAAVEATSKGIESLGEAAMELLEDPLSAAFRFTLFAAKGANSMLSLHFDSGKKREGRLTKASKF